MLVFSVGSSFVWAERLLLSHLLLHLLLRAIFGYQRSRVRLPRRLVPILGRFA